MAPSSTLVKRVQSLLSFVVLELIYNMSGMGGAAQESSAYALFHKKKNNNDEDTIPVYDMFAKGEGVFDNQVIFNFVDGDKVIPSTRLALPGLTEYTVADFMAVKEGEKKGSLPFVRRAKLANSTGAISGKTILNGAKKALADNKKQCGYWKVRQLSIILLSSLVCSTGQVGLACSQGCGVCDRQ